MAVVECASCGVSFNRSPAHIKGRSFCDRECRKKFHRPPGTCYGCGVEFPRDPKQPKRKYCTWECFKSSRWTAVTCEVCGKEFESRLSEQRKREERGHVTCCSRGCRNSYTSLLLGGDGTWAPRPGKRRRLVDPTTWRKTRAAYLALAGRTCEGCDGALVVDVHHLHPVARGGDPYSFDNLMGVCKDCHYNMHEQLRAGAFDDCLEAVCVL